MPWGELSSWICPVESIFEENPCGPFLLRSKCALSHCRGGVSSCPLPESVVSSWGICCTHYGKCCIQMGPSIVPKRNMWCLSEWHAYATQAGVVPQLVSHVGYVRGEVGIHAGCVVCMQGGGTCVQYRKVLYPGGADFVLTVESVVSKCGQVLYPRGTCCVQVSGTRMQLRQG